jgi:hypothetical protein
MKGDNELFNSKLKELEEILNTDIKHDISENELKLVLYNILKECLVRRDYELHIGDYTINLTPQKLGVIFDNDESHVEISNDDFYQETERYTEVRFFVIDKDPNKESYDASITKVVRTEGTVLNVNGDLQEIYHLELFTQFETDEIMNYININAGEITEESPTSIYIKRKINRDDPRTDTIDFLAGDNIVPVTFYPGDGKYVPNKDKRKVYEPNNYTELIPDNSDKIRIAKMIYSCVIEYYKEFISNNS